MSDGAVPHPRATDAVTAANVAPMLCSVSESEHMAHPHVHPGTVASPEQLTLLRAHPALRLAKVADVTRATVERAQAGGAVRRASLRALVSAAQYLGIPPPPDAPKPADARCLHHPGKPVFRRGVCRTCHRKLERAGLDMAAPRQGGRASKGPLGHLREWVAQFPPEHRQLLRAALEGL